MTDLTECCGAYCSEAGCCEFPKQPEPEKTEDTVSD